HSVRADMLKGLTETPFGLWLVRPVYIDTDRDPSPLINTAVTTSAALRDDLLDQVIPALVQARPPRPARRRDDPETSQRPARHHNPADLRRWLTTLAEQLRDSGTRDWRWWHLPHYVWADRRAQTRLRALAGLALGAPIGLLFGTVFGWKFGIVGGLVIVLPAMMATGLPIGVDREPRSTNLQIPRPGRALSRVLAFVLLIVFGLWLTFGLMIGLNAGLKIGLAGGFVSMLSVMAAIGLPIGAGREPR